MFNLNSPNCGTMKSFFRALLLICTLGVCFAACDTTTSVEQSISEEVTISDLADFHAGDQNSIASITVSVSELGSWLEKNPDYYGRRTNIGGIELLTSLREGKTSRTVVGNYSLVHDRGFTYVFHNSEIEDNLQVFLNPDGKVQLLTEQELLQQITSQAYQKHVASIKKARSSTGCEQRKKSLTDSRSATVCGCNGCWTCERSVMGTTHEPVCIYICTSDQGGHYWELC